MYLSFLSTFLEVVYCSQTLMHDIVFSKLSFYQLYNTKTQKRFIGSWCKQNICHIIYH